VKGNRGLIKKVEGIAGQHSWGGNAVDVKVS